MRIAIVHDYLNQYGGAERVLEVLLETFPEARVYTLFHDLEQTHRRFDSFVEKTSFLDKKIVWRNHRIFIPLMPTAASFLKLSDGYDVILSATAGFAKGISHTSQIPHLSYCYTPLRYAWEFPNYFSHWPGFMKILASPAFAYLRWWDYRAGQRPQQIIAISHFIAEKIKKYYGREADVLYPPVDLEIFYPDKNASRDGYFLAVGRFLRYKRFDLIIEAFNQLHLPLIVVGVGPEQERLKAMAHSSKIQFVPFVNENELRLLYSGAEALIFPQVEDFGLVAAEAQACGTPVIAYAGGGAREIVQEGKTGIFFAHQTVPDLVFAVKKFLLTTFSSSVIQRSAQRFSKTRFKKQIKTLVKNAQIQ